MSYNTLRKAEKIVKLNGVKKNGNNYNVISLSTNEFYIANLKECNCPGFERFYEAHFDKNLPATCSHIEAIKIHEGITTNQDVNQKKTKNTIIKKQNEKKSSISKKRRYLLTEEKIIPKSVDHENSFTMKEGKIISSKCVGDYFFDKIFSAKRNVFVISPWIAIKYAKKLIQMSEDGIKITIISENKEHNEDTIEFLSNIKQDTNFKFKIIRNLHTKLFLIDDEVGISGSVNLTHRGLFEQHNQIIITNNSSDIINFKNEFEKHWNLD